MNFLDRFHTSARWPVFVLSLMAATGSLWPLTLAAAPACIEQTSDSGGIGGTGMVASGGIGGTGDLAEGGMGGTGIIGTVTGFASVCINGLEVHYDPATPVTQNGLPANTATLALGQVIAIDASRTDRGLVANQISILNLLEGPATATNLESGAIQVMGQTVHADTATRLGGLSTLAEVQPGMALRVAGFRSANGDVYATRIEKAVGMAGSSAIGVLAQTAAGQNNLDGLPIQAMTAMPAAANQVLLRGNWDGQHLLARAAHLDPFLPFAGHAGHIVAEGIVLEHPDQEHLRINGFDVELSAATHITGATDAHINEGQRIRITGHLEGRNRIIAHGIRVGASIDQHGRGDPPNQQGSTSMPDCKDCQQENGAAMMQQRTSPPNPPPQMRRTPMPMGGAGMPRGSM